MNLSRGRWALRRIVEGRRRTLAEAAHEVVPLRPPERASVPPAIHLAGQTDKIRGFSPWRHGPDERASVGGEPRDLGACNVFVLRDADVVGPMVYAGSYKSHVGFGPEPVLADGPRDDVEGPATLATTFSGSRWFGSLLLDDFTFEVGDDPGRVVRLASKAYPQEPAYRELLGLTDSALIAHARVRALRVYDEPATSPGRASRYRRLRAALRAAVAGREPGGRVYLRRGSDGDRRVLVNEDAVEARLRSLGFEVVDPRALHPAETARRTLGAGVVAGVEGSHLSHAIFSMADDGAFLVLQPPDRFALPYKDFTDCMGMRFAFVVGDPREGGFSVDPTDLARTVELLDRTAPG